MSFIFCFSRCSASKEPASEDVRYNVSAVKFHRLPNTRNVFLSCGCSHTGREAGEFTGGEGAQEEFRFTDMKEHRRSSPSRRGTWKFTGRKERWSLEEFKVRDEHMRSSQAWKGVG